MSGSPTRLQGVFTSEKSVSSKDGNGSPLQADISVYVEENDDGTLTVQSLNEEYVPYGPTRTMTRDELLDRFIPDPGLWLNTVKQHIEQRDIANRSARRGDSHRQRQELYSAEFEYQQALDVDEEHVRATFGLGHVYMEKGDEQAASSVFERLVTLDAAFEAEHKHMFNEFGINLRKNRMFDQALRYYERARELCPEDEHLLYNISRVHHEAGRPREARRLLLQALDLNPDFIEGQEFLEALEQQGKAQSSHDLRGWKA